MNIACGRQTSLLQLLDGLCDVCATKVQPDFQPPRQGDVRDSVADISRATDRLAFAPKVSLEEGLKRTVEWFTRS